MNKIVLQDVAMLLVPGHPFLDHVAGAVRVEEARAAVARLNAEGQVAHEHAFVMVKMLIKGSMVAARRRHGIP